ncbi:transcription factor [Fusarium sporotrichioides]|uniref:Transcription factor n=1 Tax=Fusarium sporotrichioides TaxID=5514 RepID=A0A395SIQ6_FUSSP|nr:transcription factor [Fusarium sporotrichioides]
MASLKNIMNTEDEPVDPRSESRSTDLTSRSPSVHSYVTSLNYQTHSSSHNNPHDPSGSSKSSSVIDHSSPTTTDLNMNNRRRRSNMSIDSNETPYAPAQHASSSSTPMRPFTAAASGESHVRLTPITRKISKAKKGVQVHNCDQCPKTFSRAEHLSCDPDGISSAIHLRICIALSVAVTRPSTAETFLIDMFKDSSEQDALDITETERTSVQGGSKTHALSPAETPRSKRIEAFNDPRTLAPVNNNNSNVTRAWPPMASPSNLNHNYVLGPDLQAYDGFMTNNPKPRSMPDMPILPTLTDNATPELHWQDSSAPTSTFSTPPNNTRTPQFSVPVTNGSWMTPASTFPGVSSDISGTSMDHAAYSSSYAYSNTPPQVYTPVFDMGLSLPGYSEGTTFSTVDQLPTSAVRSVSPSLAVAQSETLLAVPSLPTPGGAFDLASCSSGTSGGNGLLSTQDLMPLSLSSAASEAIPRYLEVYWDQVHPKKPIIHKHTFQDVSEEETEHIHVLQCAMAALATQFIPNADDRMKGAELHAYAWQKSKVFTHIEEWSMPVQQTIALCESLVINSLLLLAPTSEMGIKLGKPGLPQNQDDDYWQPASCSILLFSEDSPNPAYSYNDKGLGSSRSSIMVKITDKKGSQNHF